MLKKLLGVAAAAALLAGCRAPAPHVKTYPIPKPDPWVLTCLDPTEPTPALLWNGLIGVRFGRDGTGGDKSKDGLSFLAISQYDSDGEEKIKPLPNPFVEEWWINGTKLDPIQGEDYAQTLDMRTGMLTSTWKQKLGPAEITVRCDAVVHPSEPVVAKRWTLSDVPRGFVEFRAQKWAVLDKPLDLIRDRPKPGVLSMFVDGYSVQGGVNNDQGTEHTEGDRRIWRTEVNAGARIILDRSVRYESKPESVTFLATAEAARKAWAERWKTDIEIDGPVEDQQAIRSFLFYLRSAIHPKGGMAISPMGLSSATYNGHVFWDADIWFFPALALVDPAAAKTIPDYRLAKFGKNHTHLPSGAVAPFPWESSVTGNEVAPPAMRNEIHVSGDVAFMLRRAAELGFADPQRVQRVHDAVNGFYLTRALQKRGKPLELLGVTSPDENHTGDNDLYTNMLAEWCESFSSRNSQLFYKLPRDAQGYLTYDNDPIRGYKQAAAVLTIYPLQMVDDQQARVMMGRFADKVTKNGPAMSQSVHALIWARLGERQKAYEAWRKSWRDYTNHALLLFSEKPNRDATYFTTGAAGCLQTVIYGFLGFRIDYGKDNMAAWSSALNVGSRLTVKPNLPAAWRSVKFKNFTVRGKRYTLTVDAQGVKVTQGES